MPAPISALSAFPFRSALAAAVLAVGLFGAAGAHAQTPSKMKQCADQWNEMKAKNQTGNLTYSQFSKQCMGADDTPAAKPSTSATTPAPSTSKPSATPASTKPSTASAKKDDDDEDAGTDKADLARCNASWKDYKAKNSVTGAKAWHVYMAKCLP